MLSRREYLTMTAAACTTLALRSRLAAAAEPADLITRAIPKTGEHLPIMGLGSSATFSQSAGRAEVDALRGVFQTMVDHGGSVFDTAPGYGASEEVSAKLLAELGLRDKIFWATKMNVAGFGGGSADAAAGRAQIETSLKRLGRKIDLLQVHNAAALETQVPIVQEYKAQGKVRYIGTTSTFKGQYGTLEQAMKDRPLDFIGVDYAVDNVSAEERILPLAQDKGIAVLVYSPTGRTRLFQRVKGREVPAWAAEFGVTSWAQFFLKFAAAHPAVTAVTPATSDPEHMIDNMAAARGRLPDAAERKRMIDVIAALPAA
ncbi:MAG TPA: aldo/keto reductase [Gammaproteobacteria bacterium]|nr:aldo/keto reductase [Gammaproteobacteria bacterium]